MGPLRIWSPHATEFNDYTVHFVVRFNKPFKLFGGWAEEDIPEDVRKIKVINDVTGIKGKGDVGAYVDFDTGEGEVVLMQTAISLVSIEQARINLETELWDPYGWDFAAVKKKAYLI